MKTALQLDLTFNQILSLIKQLPQRQKIKLVEELEKDVIDSKLTELLKKFKTDELDLDLIDEEVENLRQEIYDKQKGNF